MDELDKSEMWYKQRLWRETYTDGSVVEVYCTGDGTADVEHVVIVPSAGGADRHRKLGDED